jgi:hypothetical protein
VRWIASLGICLTEYRSSSMSLIHRLHGAVCAPLRQQLRRSDGVRGVFAAKPLQRGELVLSLPLHYCYVTRLGPDRAHPAGWTSTAAGARELRRWNRGVALLPEVWTWMQRFSCDATRDVVSLTSSVSADAAVAVNGTGCILDQDCDGNLQCHAPSIVSMTVSPVEASLATAIALRFFFTHALHLTVATRVAERLGPPPNELTERFVSNLPLERYMQLGVEAIYGGSGDASEAHLCLEQITQNLRDAVLTHASTAEYRFLDEFPSLFDHLLLVCLYVVRSRVLTVPLLGRTEGISAERNCSVFAPLLDGLNHEPLLPSAAAVVSLQRQRLVVRATRDVHRGEEVTLNYRATRPLARVPSQENDAYCGPRSPAPYELPMDEDWTTRYLMEDDTR